MPNQPECILFQGLGGAGQRHLRIFRELLPDTRMLGFRVKSETPVLNDDFSVKEGVSLEEEYGIELLPSLQAAYNQKPNLAVIATPTSFHAEHAVQAAENGVDVFVEKPGALNLSEAQKVRSAVKTNGISYFISFQRRFHPLLIRLRDLLELESIGNVMAIRVAVASYVPDWHPYEDFRSLYACRADLGGGVLRTEIHEIDFITSLFGLPEKIHSTTGRRGLYDIDVEDSAELLLDYGAFTVQITLCFMQRNQERSFRISGQNGWIFLDLMSQRLEVGKHETGTVNVFDEAVTNDELFRLQASHFLANQGIAHHASLDALENNMKVIDKIL